MPPMCSACRHPKRREIDRLLIDGATVRDVGARYGLSKTAVDRHRNRCIARAVVKAEIVKAENVAAELKDLKRRLWQGLERAELNRDDPAFIAYCKELRGIIDQHLGLQERGRAPAGPVTVVQRFNLMIGIDSTHGLQMLDLAQEDFCECKRDLEALAHLVRAKMDAQPQPKARTPSKPTRFYDSPPPVKAQENHDDAEPPPKPPPAPTPAPASGTKTAVLDDDAPALGGMPPDWRDYLAGNRKL
jgi:hypothetical protein